MAEGKLHASSVNMDETGKQISINGLMLFDDGDKDSIVSRLAEVLKEAVTEWRVNPSGSIQIKEAMIGRTYIGPHPAADRC